MTSRCALLTLLVVGLASSSAAQTVATARAADKPLVGSFVPVPVDEGYVAMLANVSYWLLGRNGTIDEVVDARKQVVHGTNYVLTVRDQSDSVVRLRVHVDGGALSVSDAVTREAS